MNISVTIMSMIIIMLIMISISIGISISISSSSSSSTIIVIIMTCIISSASVRRHQNKKEAITASVRTVVRSTAYTPTAIAYEVLKAVIFLHIGKAIETTKTGN